MKRILTGLLITAITTGMMCLTAVPQAAAQQLSIEDMAKLLPGSINALMVVNAERIKNSGISKKEGWADTQAGKVASGLIFLPGSANVIVLGSVMDYDTFDARETSALVSMDKVPPLEIIRQVTDGKIDVVAGTQVVETPDDHFIAPINEHLAAALRPALRPYFARWLASLQKGETSRVPDYLEEGLGYAQDLGTEVIVAFNLGEVISASQALERIQGNDQVRQASLNPKEVAQLVASVRGCTLGITIRDKMVGAIKFDFTEDISSLQPLARQLATGLCNRTGFHLDEFDEWNVELSGKQVKLSGELSTESLRKVLSIVDAPQSHTTDVTSQEQMESENLTDPVVATKKYFDTVNSFVDQLAPKLSPAVTYTENANWFRKYADKIDGMGTLNVDQDMIAYGDYVSQILRESALLMINTRESTKEQQQALIASGARSGGGWGGGYAVRGYSRYGRWGGRYGRSGGDGSRLRRAARNQQKSQAIKTVAQGFEEIATERRNVKQSMTDKYQTQFIP